MTESSGAGPASAGGSASAPGAGSAGNTRGAQSSRVLSRLPGFLPVPRITAPMGMTDVPLAAHGVKVEEPLLRHSERPLARYRAELLQNRAPNRSIDECSTAGRPTT